MIIGTVWKLPAEVLTRAVDFSQELAPGEMINAIVSLIVLDSSGNDVSSTISGPAVPIIIPPANTVVQFQLQNGTLNAVYKITLTVGSNAGNTYQASLSLVIGVGIALTTLLNVKNWVQISQAATQDDQIIQDAILSFSAYVLRVTGRGPADGSFPLFSPFLAPIPYDEFYDGSGSMRQAVRNWPITSVTSVSVNGQTIQQSTSINVWGWVIDGDAKFISIRGGYNPGVATFQNYRYQYSRGGAFQGPGFSVGNQNVEIVYSAGFTAVPLDLEMTARKIVALNYKRRNWIGQRSQAMAAGAGTVSYNEWEMDAADRSTLLHYQRRVA